MPTKKPEKKAPKKKKASLKVRSEEQRKARVRIIGDFGEPWTPKGAVDNILVVRLPESGKLSVEFV